MKRRPGLFLAASLVCVALSASAQGPAPAGPMPPGHPPVGDDPAPAPPTPPGTPGRPQPRQDQSVASSELPVGTVVAKIADANGNPIPSLPVRLAVQRQSVAEGDSSDFKAATTNGEGKVRFVGLESGGKFSYRILVKNDPAEYASASFNLREDMGQSVVLHVYPVTRDIKRSMVGARGFVMVAPRDDVFQFEVLFRVFNVGTTTWVPDDLVLELPEGWKAFSAQESMDDTRVAAEGDRGVRLLGTFSPGQHDVAFRFQVPNDHDETVDFRLTLPPHMAELQVMSEAAKGMGFEVAGMSPPQPTVGEDGRRMLATGRQLKPGEPEMQDVSIRLTGIPSPGQGRWYAVGFAVALAALGLYYASQGNEKGKSEIPEKDISKARRLLLDELVALEQAREKQKIGPKTYEGARRSLIDALARLDALAPLKTKPAKVGKRRAAAH